MEDHNLCFKYSIKYTLTTIEKKGTGYRKGIKTFMGFPLIGFVFQA
jgi:hypothetical protein